MGNQSEHRTSMGKAPGGATPRPPLASQSPERPTREGLREIQGRTSFSRREESEHLVRQVETASRLGHNFAKLPARSGHQENSEPEISLRATNSLRSPDKTSQPIQRTASFRRFRNGRTRLASRKNDVIGSVYAQSSKSRYNRGHRIRLEHRGGPHLSRRRSYRHVKQNGLQTLLPNTPIGGFGTGRLVETHSRNGRVRHKSRGALGDMEALSNDRTRALFDLAQASDADRANIGPNQAHANEAAHAAVHNQRLRELLRSPLFAGHELATGQAARDLLPGALLP
jgi:hypothetical protein